MKTFIKNLRFLFITVLAVSFSLHAQAPQLINYQGMLKDADGKPIVTEVTVAFLVYDSETATESLWEEEHIVTPIDGFFNVLLGSKDTLEVNLFTSHDELYLAMKVGADAEMAERFRLSSVAYALNAAQADNVADDAISREKIKDGEVQEADLANNSVTAEKIKNGEVKNAKLADDAVNSDKIQNASITLDKFNTSAASAGNALMYDGTKLTWQTPQGAGDITGVTAAGGLSGGGTEGNVSLSIASGGVNSDRIQDGTITAADLGTNSVTADEISANAVGSSEIADNAVITGKIASGAVGNTDLAANAVTAVKILDEPGISQGIGTGRVEITGATNMKDVAITEISIPSSGYIVVNATSQAGLYNTTASNYMELQIDENQGGDREEQYYFLVGLAIPPNSGRYWMPVAIQRTFYKNAGTYTFRLEALDGTGNGTKFLWNSTITAIFYATSYGKVNLKTSDKTQIQNNNID